MIFAPHDKFTDDELKVIDEIVGGRYDTLTEMLEQFPHMPDKKKLQKDADDLRPLVEKIRRNIQ